MKKVIILSFLFISCLSLNIVFAHGGEDHKPKKQDTLSVQENQMHQDDMANMDHAVMMESKVIHAEMDDFSNLHPLVVHFPIVLLLLAFVLQLVAFFIWKKEMNWLAFFLLLFGFIGAYAASTYLHPHTGGLTEAASKVLEQHDLYADYTLWLSGIGLLLKSISLFLLKDKLWLEIAITLLLVGAAYSVIQTGHYGATLIHIHGVGAQGTFIESAADGHNHSH